LNEKDKNWKFSPADLAERAWWDSYQEAYEKAITATAAPHAPWFVIPSDNKWFTRLVVVAAIVEALDRLDLKPQALTKAELANLEVARRALEAEDD
jgi:polyphosphate kinase 2 (PPK2 family)